MAFWKLRLTVVACNVFASFFKTDDGVLGIAFNKGGVQCFCIYLSLKNTMAFLEIAFNNGGVQCFCIFFFNRRWRS